MLILMFNIILFTHITAGAIALASAGVAIFSRKGASAHRRFGRIYALAMLAVGVSAIVLGLLRFNAFLLAISLFTLYLVFTGWRAAMVRSGADGKLDRAAGLGMALIGTGMIGWGLFILSTGEFHPSIVLIVFGMIGVTLSLFDWRHWKRGPIAGTPRIARHLSRMLAGTIATLTATAVVNLGHLPSILVWLGPTVLLTPVIAWWTAKLDRSGSQRGVSG